MVPKQMANRREKLNILDIRNAQLGFHKNEFHSFSKFSNWCKDPQEIDELMKKLWIRTFQFPPCPLPTSLPFHRGNKQQNIPN